MGRPDFAAASSPPLPRLKSPPPVGVVAPDAVGAPNEKPEGAGVGAPKVGASEAAPWPPLGAPNEKEEPPEDAAPKLKEGVDVEAAGEAG